MKKRPVRMACMVVAAWAWAMPAWAAGIDAQQAFDRLKTLAGSWHGVPEGEGADAAEEADHDGKVHHEIVVSANGTVVKEIMGPGTPHEMINMYHLDGDDLVVTHYCSSGNQPMMRLDRKASSADDLVFLFDGGTNLDPAKDVHIHAARIKIEGEDHVESMWTGYNQGREAGTMTFHLARER